MKYNLYFCLKSNFMKKILLCLSIFFIACKKENTQICVNHECGNVIEIFPTMLNGKEALNIKIKHSDGHETTFGTYKFNHYYIGKWCCIEY